MRRNFDLFLASLATFSAALVTATIFHSPESDIPWGSALYVSFTSLLLIGLPTVRLLQRLNLKSFADFALGGTIASLISATVGIGILFALPRIGGFRWIRSEPDALIAIVLAYIACGSATATIYWLLARPDRQ
jgi:hypothetical protein